VFLDSIRKQTEGKWMELENIILSEVKVTKEHIWYVLIVKRMLAENSLLKGASS
jgi:hypothetical protein